MRRSMVFAERILKELGRDPLSFLFCLVFPAVMLGLMTFLDHAIPAEAGMNVFGIDQLTPAIALFSYSFVMLFGSLLLSKDRSGAFLIRLYASPLRAWDYLAGYALPLLLVGIAQTVVTFLLGQMIGALSGTTMPLLGMIAAALCLLPALVLFTALGLLFGALLNDKAAPGVCSIFISLSAFLGGCWMDVAAIGGAMEKLCCVLPFYPAVRLARSAVSGTPAMSFADWAVLIAWLVLTVVLAVFVFADRMKSDQK